jgi:hypothetical protein
MQKQCATLLLLSGVLSGTAWAAGEETADLSNKLQPYIACINRLSERAYSSHDRYVDWAGDGAALKTKAKNILGLYEIYETGDCAKGVEEANSSEPHNPDLESTGSAYVKAVTTLEPMLKTASDYYEQGNYKDDKMAKGKELHPQLLAAFTEFAKADQDLRGVVQKINDEIQIANIAEIEKTEGRNSHFLLETVMLQAKTLVRLEGDVEMNKIDLDLVTKQVGVYETSVNEFEAYLGAHPEETMNSTLVDQSKGFLVTAKNLMRRVRDKEAFNEGEKMMLGEPNAGWMVEGSQPRLMRDYNELIDSYNRQ